MKIALRVLAGGKYGWGNFDRLLTIANELKKNKNYSLYFYIENSIKAFNITKKIFPNTFFLNLKLGIKERKEDFFNINYFDILIYEASI